MKVQKYRIDHSLVIGKPGAGKTTLISEMLQTAKSKNPNLKAFVVDVKNDLDQAIICVDSALGAFIFIPNADSSAPTDTPTDSNKKD